MKEQLPNVEMLDFIREHEHEDPAELILSGNIPSDWPTHLIADQIASRKKAKKKLPEMYEIPGFIFPPPANLEQASSEKTARFKSTLVQGNILIDLTGGSGIDCFYLQQNFNNTYFCEPDEHLCKIAEHNAEILNVNLTVLPQKAEQALSELPYADLVYIDPSRRTEGRKRVNEIHEYEPNVNKLYDSLIKAGRELMIKISPMANINKTIKQLPGAYRVIALSVNGELKEILIVCRDNFVGEIQCEAVHLKENKPDEVFRFMNSEEKHARASYGSKGRYLYVPNPSVNKLGAFNLISMRFGLDKLHANTHLYVSYDLKETFPGKILEITDRVKPGKKSIKKLYPSGIVNIASRNFPLKINDLKKKYGLKDGGEDIIYFCEIAGEGKSALICKPLTDS